MAIHELGFFSNGWVALTASLFVLSPIFSLLWMMDYGNGDFPSRTLAGIVIGAPILWLITKTFMNPQTGLGIGAFYLFYFFAAANALYAFFSWFAHEFANPSFDSSPFFKNKDVGQEMAALLVVLDGILLGLFFGLFRASSGVIHLPVWASVLGALIYLAPIVLVRIFIPMARFALSETPGLDLIPFWSFFRFIQVWSRPSDYHGYIIKDGVGRVDMVTYYDMYENMATLLFTYLIFVVSFARVVGIYFMVCPWL